MFPAALIWIFLVPRVLRGNFGTIPKTFFTTIILFQAKFLRTLIVILLIHFPNRIYDYECNNCRLYIDFMSFYTKYHVRMKRNVNRYISHPPQREMKRHMWKSSTLKYRGSSLEPGWDMLMKGRDVSSWVTAASPFTTFGGRDPNCLGYDAIFRRIWANGKRNAQGRQ